MRKLQPAGQVEGFGPLNDGVQSAIDEIMRQTRETLVPEITRQLREQVVPTMTSNTEMQDRIGKSAGESITKTLKPYVFVGVTSLVIIAGAGLYYLATKD